MPCWSLHLISSWNVLVLFLKIKWTKCTIIEIIVCIQVYNWCESPISESVWRCVLAVQVVSKWNHFCLLSASYMLCYLPIYGEPCSTCFFNSLHQRAPLHWAAGEDQVDAVRCLVDKGADINIKNGHSVSEWEYNVDCKLVLLFRVCTQSPSQWSGVHFCWICNHNTVWRENLAGTLLKEICQ